MSATDRLRLPTPDVGMSPTPEIEGLVGLQTWLWVDEGQWRALSESVSARGTTVTARAEPVQLVWDMGVDEFGRDRVGCAGPGRVWTRAAGQGEESYCGYTYAHTSVGEPDGAFTVTATLRYQVRWTCSGVCIAQAGTLDELVSSPTESVAYPVTERQTVVVDNPPGYD